MKQHKEPMRPLLGRLQQWGENLRNPWFKRAWLPIHLRVLLEEAQNVRITTQIVDYSPTPKKGIESPKNPNALVVMKCEMMDVCVLSHLATQQFFRLKHHHRKLILVRHFISFMEISVLFLFKESTQIRIQALFYEK